MAHLLLLFWLTLHTRVEHREQREHRDQRREIDLLSLAFDSG